MALVVVALVALTVGSGDDDGQEVALAPDEPPGDSPENPSGGDPSTTGVTFLGDEAHEHLPADPGCDQLSFHSAMAMWDPTFADEMFDYDCPFPFDAAEISMEGGAEDPSITAPYEPRRYQEIFDVINAEQFGLCAVGRIGEPSVRGFVYGFSITVHSETCAGSNPNVAVIVREYASRAHRDEAANTITAPVVQVLGRFAITVEGEDPAAIDQLAASFVAIGAEQISS